MSNNQQLIYAIIKFLRDQLTINELPPDGAEGVEVAVQCLESAYDITSVDNSKLEVPKPLIDIFKDYLSRLPVKKVAPEASPEEKVQAEKFKNEGNSFLHAENYKKAVACYTKAIKLDPNNAVYYCNRAAAYTKMTNFYGALQDCNTALSIDPHYSKAHSRLGLVYSCLNLNEEALESYKKASELEPQNESVRSNIRLIREKMMAPLMEEALQNYQGVDIRTALTNPTVLNMASQMLTNPSMHSMMANILQSQPSSNVVEVVLQTGQQLAQQMESANPGLVDQLRRHLSGSQTSPTPPSPPTPPDSTP